MNDLKNDKAVNRKYWFRLESNDGNDKDSPTSECHDLEEAQERCQSIESNGWVSVFAKFLLIFVVNKFICQIGRVPAKWRRKRSWKLQVQGLLCLRDCYYFYYISQDDEIYLRVPQSIFKVSPTCTSVQLNIPLFVELRAVGINDDCCGLRSSVFKDYYHGQHHHRLQCISSWTKVRLLLEDSHIHKESREIRSWKTTTLHYEDNSNSWHGRCVRLNWLRRLLSQLVVRVFLLFIILAVEVYPLFFKGHGTKRTSGRLVDYLLLLLFKYLWAPSLVLLHCLVVNSLPISVFAQFRTKILMRRSPGNK